MSGNLSEHFLDDGKISRQQRQCDTSASTGVGGERRMVNMKTKMSKKQGAFHYKAFN